MALEPRQLELKTSKYTAVNYNIYDTEKKEIICVCLTKYIAVELCKILNQLIVLDPMLLKR